MTNEIRQQQINDAREMLDWLEANPEIPMFSKVNIHSYFYSSNKADFLLAAKTLGTYEKKIEFGDLALVRHFGTATVTLSIPQSAVCKKVQVMKLVDDYECEPLLTKMEIAAL